MIELHHGDCLEVMKGIPDGSVDLVLCDLPYGTTQNKWDSIIPLDALWTEYKRVCRGAIVLTAAQPFTSALVISNLAWFKYDWTWRKPKGTGHLNAKKQPMRDKEDILVFYAKQPTYNPQFSAGEPFGNKRGANTPSYGEHGAVNYANDGKRYPKQVLEFGVVERGTVHPTQKPVALMEYLIRTYSNEGDTVLDNCAGSFTTGVACLNTDRSFIGIEQDAEYFRIGSERMRRRQDEINALAAAHALCGMTGSSKSGCQLDSPLVV
jgi:site-specific DNA-methyltransferase (adenine-specific)